MLYHRSGAGEGTACAIVPSFDVHRSPSNRRCQHGTTSTQPVNAPGARLWWTHESSQRLTGLETEAYDTPPAFMGELRGAPPQPTPRLPEVRCRPSADSPICISTRRTRNRLRRRVFASG